MARILPLEVQPDGFPEVENQLIQCPALGDHSDLETLSHEPVLVPGQNCVNRFPGIVYCFRRSPLQVRNLLDVLWRPAVASAAAGAFVLLTTALGMLSQHLGWNLMFQLIQYAAGYMVSWCLLPQGVATLRDMVHLVKDLRTSTESLDAH